MSFYCIKLSGLSGLYKLFQTSGNFTKYRQGNQGIIKGFFLALGWESCNSFNSVDSYNSCIYYSCK